MQRTLDAPLIYIEAFLNLILKQITRITMNQKECRDHIIREWRSWKRKSSTPTWQEKYDFYSWLETNRPDLLSFRVSKNQDKWQTVHVWLIEAEK
jgi:protease II